MRKKIILLFSLIMVLSFVRVPTTAQAEGYNIDFDLYSQAAILVNLDTNTTVFEKNADVPRSPASTTKIMTYIVTAEHVADLDGTMITVPDNIDDLLAGTDSSISGLVPGEVMSVENMLNCLLVPSGNDAALVLASFIGNGDINAFVDMMNQKAAELGCTNTHFANPHGLYDKDHYTTARDLYKITNYAITLPRFMQTVTQIEHQLPDDNKRSNIYPLETTNLMQLSSKPYYYKYIKGIKTGSLDEAGKCLVSSAVKDGYSYLCVALGAHALDAPKTTDPETHGEMVDTKKLYEWAFDTLELKPLISNLETPVAEINLELAWQKDTLLLLPEKNLSALLPVDIQNSSIICTPNDDVPRSIKAPVKKGDVIGTATVSYANKVLGTVNLVAKEDVDRSELLYYLQGAKNVVTSKWFIIAVIAFFSLFLLYLILSAIYNKREKRRRRVKKYCKF